MNPDLSELVKKVDDQLTAHPNATLRIVAEKLVTTEDRIEEALQNIEGLSFREYQDNKRLVQAFKQLGEFSPAADGPYELTRSRRRLMIPKTTVQYRQRRFWKRKSSYSDRCPLVDFSCEGLAFLADSALKAKDRLSLLLKFPDEDEAIRLDGCVVYAVATGIAGYRYRIGIQYLPFAEKRGFNSTNTLDALVRLEKTYSS